MRRTIRENQFGRSDLGWQYSRFHFSFTDCHNPANVRFGKLRVLDDDLVEAGSGFDMHGRRDMEIIDEDVVFSTTEGAHFLFIEMPREL